MDLNKLVAPIQEIIKSYIWGDKDDWKRKLDIVRKLPSRPHVFLTNRDGSTETMNSCCCERCGRVVTEMCTVCRDDYRLIQY